MDELEGLEIVDPPPSVLLEDGRVRVHVPREDGGTVETDYIPAAEVDAMYGQFRDQLLDLDAQLTATEKQLADAQARLDEAGRGPDPEAPCLGCYRPLRPAGPWVAWPCCDRAMHLACCQRTVFRAAAATADRCPACLGAAAAARVAGTRRDLIEVERVPPLTNQPKVRICKAAGLLPDLAERPVYDSRTAARIDEAWLGLRGGKLAEAYVRVGQIVEACRRGARRPPVALSPILRDLGVPARSLLDPPPRGLGLRTADLQVLADLGHLAEDGLTAELMRTYSMQVGWIRTDQEEAADRVEPETLCKLGFTAYDLLAMGLRADHLARINWTPAAWILYLGADATWFRLAFPDAAALEAHRWRVADVEAELGLEPGKLLG